MGGLVGGRLFSPVSSTATSAGSWGGVGSGGGSGLSFLRRSVSEQSGSSWS